MSLNLAKREGRKRSEFLTRRLRWFSPSLVALVVLTGAFLCGAPSAYADSVTLNFTNTFPGSTTPAGSLSLTFTDVTGGVLLTIDDNLTSNEFLNPNKALYFDFTGSLSSLNQFTPVGSAPSTTEAFGTEEVNPTGGVYDILMSFSQDLTSGTSESYMITSSSPIDAEDFDAMNTPVGSGSVSAVGAANVLFTNARGTGGAWIDAPTATTVVDTLPTPEPSGLILLGAGLIVATLLLRRSQKVAAVKS